MDFHTSSYLTFGGVLNHPTNPVIHLWNPHLWMGQRNPAPPKGWLKPYYNGINHLLTNGINNNGINHLLTNGINNNGINHLLTNGINNNGINHLINWCRISQPSTVSTPRWHLFGRVTAPCAPLGDRHPGPQHLLRGGCFTMRLSPEGASEPTAEHGELTGIQQEITVGFHGS